MNNASTATPKKSSGNAGYTFAASFDLATRKRQKEQLLNHAEETGIELEITETNEGFRLDFNNDSDLLKFGFSIV